MSSEIVFFSSSSRSMRSMMALSWSLANFVAGASLTAAAVVAIGYYWMELRVDAEEEAPHAFPRTASQHDPQECGAWRQGNIALIHSAPTEERGKLHPLSSLRGAKRRSNPVSRRYELLRFARNDGKTQCPLWAFFIAASCSGLALP